MKHILPSRLVAFFGLLPMLSTASSHMDAPLITLDPAANTADVYAFRSLSGDQQYLTTAVTVYPFEEPGIGPNKYGFDPSVLYEIHVSMGDDLAAGRPTISYAFKFTDSWKNKNTILQSYLGVITDVDDASQNLTQRYTVTRVDRREHGAGRKTQLGQGVVPPNNQGIATPFYNQGDNGENRAKEGITSTAALDRYTASTVYTFSGHQVFCGQRDDGFYGDIQAVFDLLKLRNPGQDAQGGYNVHTIALNIPLADLGGGQQVVGVYATTSRQKMNVLRKPITKRGETDVPFNQSLNLSTGNWVQVGRQGNPLFCEALVAIVDKDIYNRSSPSVDTRLFRKYAENPELAGLLNALVLGANVAPTTGRSDIVGIFVPDLIKVDLSTGPARLTGAGSDDFGFSRLGIFGGDVLTSSVQEGFGSGTIPGGWPNGRRFGDDVVDIAVTALISDLRTSPPTIRGPAGDNVNGNDITYNKVFPYAATPLNGRAHSHHTVD